MNCPKCGSEVWENAAKVATGWRGPLRKCKNQGCDWLEWPPKGQKAAAIPRAPAGPKWTWAQLRQTYARSVAVAKKELDVVKGVTSADITAGAATVFICATRDGVAELNVPAPEPEDIPF